MRGVPDEPWIERRRCKHGQDHHRGEERQSGARLRCHQRPELNQCDDESDDEYVEHRPATDQLDHPVEARAIAGAVRRAAPHADQQVGKRGELPQRDRKSTRLNSSHGYISYDVFCLKKKTLSCWFTVASTPRSIARYTRLSMRGSLWS